MCAAVYDGAVPPVLADSDDQASTVLPVTTRGLPYLNTMHYIVRVISYISRLNKHRLNI